MYLHQTTHFSQFSFPATRLFADHKSSSCRKKNLHLHIAALFSTTHIIFIFHWLPVRKALFQLLIHQSSRSFKMLLYILNSIAATDIAFVVKWKALEQNYPSSDITQTLYTQITKHTSDGTHLSTCSQQLKHNKDNKHSVIPHFLTPPFQCHQKTYIHGYPFSCSLYKVCHSVEWLMFLYGTPAPLLTRVPTSQKPLNTSLTSVSRLFVAPPLQQQAFTHAYFCVSRSHATPILPQPHP